MALSVVGGRARRSRPRLAGARPRPSWLPAGAGRRPAGAESRLDGPRRLEIVKTNLCRHPPPLGLIFEGENVAVPTLRYTEYVEPPPQPTQADLCAGWLFHFLDAAGEPVKPADAVRAGGRGRLTPGTPYIAPASSSVAWSSTWAPAPATPTSAGPSPPGSLTARPQEMPLRQRGHSGIVQ